MYGFISIAALGLLASTGLVEARSTRSEAPSATPCATALATPTPAKLNCGIHGSLQRENLLVPTLRKKTLQACRNSCLENEACISFGFGKSASQCNLYKANLISQGIQDKNVDKGFVYYNHKCFKVTCPTGPACPPDQAGNVIQNPSFENSPEDSNTAEDWDVHSTFQFSDQDEAEDGEAYMALYVDDPNDVATLSQDLSGLEVGSSYAFQYWFKPEFYETNIRGAHPPNCTFSVGIGDVKLATHQYFAMTDFGGSYVNDSLTFKPAVESGKLVFSWSCSSFEGVRNKDFSEDAELDVDNVVLSKCTS